MDLGSDGDFYWVVDGNNQGKVVQYVTLDIPAPNVTQENVENIDEKVKVKTLCESETILSDLSKYSQEMNVKEDILPE